MLRQIKAKAKLGDLIEGIIRRARRDNVLPEARGPSDYKFAVKLRAWRYLEVYTFGHAYWKVCFL